MIWQLDLLLLALLTGCAVVAVFVRSMIATVAVLGAFSFLVALLFAGMGAPDVAFVEAVLGSAFVGVLLLVAVLATGDRPAGRDRRAVWITGPLILGFAALLLVASADLPDRGDPTAPSHQGVARQYVERSLEDSDTPNVVTAILADYRSVDTLGETLVVFTAALAASLVIARGRST
jgi:multicomponent Na+:H+ antiporter subunit B